MECIRSNGTWCMSTLHECLSSCFLVASYLHKPPQSYTGMTSWIAPRLTTTFLLSCLTKVNFRKKRQITYKNCRIKQIIHQYDSEHSKRIVRGTLGVCPFSRSCLGCLDSFVRLTKKQDYANRKFFSCSEFGKCSGKKVGENLSEICVPTDKQSIRMEKNIITRGQR